MRSQSRLLCCAALSRRGAPALGATRREAEVALLLAEALTNEMIATRLFVSRHTMRHHTENILSKLNIRTRSEVALKLYSIK